MTAPTSKEGLEIAVVTVMGDGNLTQELQAEIARLKGVEAALREREKELTEAHRVARLGIWHWDRATDTVTWSDEVYRTFECDPGLPPPGYEEIQKLHTPGSRERLSAAVARAVATGEPYELDVELTMPSGRRKWILSRGEVKAYVNGEVAQLGGTIQDITERKLSEAALRASDERFRKLYESDLIGIGFPDHAGGISDGNDELLRIVGYSRKEMEAGQVRWDRMTPPEYRELDAGHIAEMAERGSCTPYEKEYIRKDGIRVPILCGYARVGRPRDESIGFILDLSKRKNAEQALRESQSRFRKLFESDLIGICFPDKFGGFSEGNDEFLRVVGYTRDDLKEGLVRWDTMTPPEYQALDAAHIAEAATRGGCTPYEKEYIRKDGSRVPILCGYVLLEGSQDEYIGFIMDRSAQKQAEEALRKSEQRFRDLAESLPQMVWVTNAALENTYCNQRFCDYTGLPVDKMLGMAWHHIIHPEDLGATLEKSMHCVETGEPYLNEYRLRRHDGAYRYFLARAVPVRNQDGQIERWLGSSTDIHDQKLAEEALRRTEKLAATGRLAASIAHEINNPLAAVTNTLYLALKDETLNETTRNYLATAEQELARVAHVTTQTLKFHRQSTAPALADLSGIMESAFSLFAARFKACMIDVKQEYKTRAQLYCYSDELRQVFANLIGNALDATPEGERVRIRIQDAHSWDRQQKRGLRVVVADTGHGIPVELRKRIFEPFVSTKDDTGTGLGLWVTETILQKHGGRISLRSVTSGPNRGTVFSLFFPFSGIAPLETTQKK
jgi:hypothetical protein